MSRVLPLLRQNWASGLTVALVSVPLSISLAIASGAPPLMGIITAVWAGALAALFGGSAYNVVGPAGALSAILMLAALNFGPEALPLMAFVVGVLSLVAYVLQWQKYLVFIPSAVIHGFTLGVALTIGLNQLNFALGLSGLPQHESLVGNILESLRHLGAAQWQALLTFSVGLVLLFVLVRLAPKLPGAIVLAALGITIGALGSSGVIPFPLQTLQTRYGDLTMAVFSVPDFLVQSPFETLRILLEVDFLKLAITAAIVAVLETLLSAKIADGMTGTRFDQRREVLGTAIANLGSGLAGGLPASGVFVRTAINVKAGATSRVSSLLNALFVLVICLVCFSWFQYLPLAVVAAILVFASIRMVQAQHFQALYRLDRHLFWLSLLVALLTFSVDSLIGILVGASGALLLFASRLAKGHTELTIHHGDRSSVRVPHTQLCQLESHGCVTVVRLSGELTYFNAQAHAQTLKQLRCPAVVLSLRNLYYVDPDGVEELGEMIHETEVAGRQVVLAGVCDTVRSMLVQVPWFQRLEREGRVYDRTMSALTALGFPVGKGS